MDCTQVILPRPRESGGDELILPHIYIYYMKGACNYFPSHPQFQASMNEQTKKTVHTFPVLGLTDVRVTAFSTNMSHLLR